MNSVCHQKAAGADHKTKDKSPSPAGAGGRGTGAGAALEREHLSPDQSH